MTLSPAAQPRAHTERCSRCGNSSYQNFRTLDSAERRRYELRKSLVWMTRPLYAYWKCEGCGHEAGFKVAMERPKRQDPPIRKDRVAAINNLRRAGYRFFEWEKSRV